ncbi:MAG: 5-(carboxyamino)imidazole ribonucleotide synthase [Dethiobacter sp.]|jgi:5-(carboxyamino)imidazole ribonucleotide synthase|nr:5-(carboxyamino)imidazole ribonucleotide synthase [Dethiobacter sp.]
MLNRIAVRPPFRIAIVGGGQLGKMMTVAAKQLGFHVTVLDPTPESPAAQVADRQVVAAFTDGEAIRSLAASADVITYEFEHIDCSSLLALEEDGYPVFPTARLLRIIQNKLTQKKALAKANIPVPSFLPAADSKEAGEAAAKLGFPLLLKACRGGYDGKGNALVMNAGELDAQFESLGGCEILVEEFIPFTCEVSVMVARGRFGEIKSYPLSENEHADNILRQSVVPARVAPAVELKSRQVAESVMSLFSGVGVFCVEMFVTAQGEVLVNEVAPRPHNSGHYTIEACVTSQFEQHIRAIAGLPLGDTTLVQPAVMVNLLGEEGFYGPAVLEGTALALSLPGVHLHLYGKSITSPLRKMGHITVTAPKLAQAIDVAARAGQALRVISQEGESLNE